MARKVKKGSDTRSARKKGNAAAARFMLCMLFVVSLFAVKIYTDARLSERILERSRVRDKIDMLKGEKIRLSVEIERKKDLKEVERLAISQYGMKKPDQFQIEYVTLDVPDKSEIIRHDNESALSGLAKNFAIFLEYFS